MWLPEIYLRDHSKLKYFGTYFTISSQSSQMSIIIKNFKRNCLKIVSKFTKKLFPLIFTQFQFLTNGMAYSAKIIFCSLFLFPFLFLNNFKRFFSLTLWVIISFNPLFRSGAKQLFYSRPYQRAGDKELPPRGR